MADGKYFLKKVQETFDGDATLQGLISGGIKTKVAKFTPVNNEYPQICLFLSEGYSQMVFPAGYYRLYLTVWVKKTNRVSQPFGTIRQILKRVNELLNRKASSISEIDISANTGLRVAKCLKSGGFINFEKETGLYSADMEFELVLSEDESFDPSDAGNKEWT